MASDEIQITRRHLPHWTQEGATYFVTFRLLEGQLTTEEQLLVLEHIKEGHNRFYKLAAAIVMPDHVHLMLIPEKQYSLSDVMKGMKGALARKINLLRKASGSVWQNESFDRIMRDDKEFDEKMSYMLNNPAKKELTDDPWNYHGWYYNENYFE